MDLGAEPFREVLGSSLELGERVLTELGSTAAAAHRVVKRFRQHDEDLLRRQYLVYDDEAAVIQTSREARADLMHLFEADIETEAPPPRGAGKAVTGDDGPSPPADPDRAG